MIENRQYGRPLLLADLSESAEAQLISRVRLDARTAYNEAWLQRLIMKYPGVLPIGELEPAIAPIVPICTELPVRSGSIDNLYVSPLGDVVVAETKLWRNPQARREVIGQIVDYAKDLSVWRYADLDRAVRSARSRGTAGEKVPTIYETVSATVGDIDEASFIDSISRNLARGRFLLLVVGDGIQESAEEIAAFLQRHAALHFTLAMVELAIFEMPNAAYLVQPRILKRTLNIERAIVTIEDGHVAVLDHRPVARVNTEGELQLKKTSISQERFYEELNKNCAGVASKLMSFVDELAPLAVFADFGTRSLILRWRVDQDESWTLGVVSTNGKLWTEYLNSQANNAGLLELGHGYIQKLAEIVPGAYVKKEKPLSWYAAKDGTYLYVDELLVYREQWMSAMKEFVDKAGAALRERSVSLRT